MAIWKLFSSKSGKFRSVFLIKIPLQRSKSEFSGQICWKFVLVCCVVRGPGKIRSGNALGSGQYEKTGPHKLGATSGNALG